MRGEVVCLGEPKCRRLLEWSGWLREVYWLWVRG